MSEANVRLPRGIISNSNFHTNEHITKCEDFKEQHISPVSSSELLEEENLTTGFALTCARTARYSV